RGAEQQRWLDGWIQIAEQLGAPRVRVPAGDQAPTEETLALSARRLRALAASHPGIRVLTANWKSLLVDAEVTRDLLDRLEGEVGLLIDTGNWDGEDKHTSELQSRFDLVCRLLLEKKKKTDKIPCCRSH